MSRRPDRKFWAGKRVFMTGHTGFKGGWLSLWLRELGAELAGYALAPATSPNFFDLAEVATQLHHEIGDVRDGDKLYAAMADFVPDIVLHLAAQPLVRESYRDPMQTFETNLMGTVNVLHAMCKLPNIRTGLIVTTDKVYVESAHAHAETDRLGGHDPYSASKACAELAAAAFPLHEGQRLATLRSGNVIGGGDWSPDRLVADIIRAVMAGEMPEIRNPHAIRPWQHVLDPLCGYLLAAEQLWHTAPGHALSWNFGPDTSSEVSVSEVADVLCRHWGNAVHWRAAVPDFAPHEADILRLDSTKARDELGWQPGWDLDHALANTVSWYKDYAAGEQMLNISLAQIAAYQKG